MKMVTGYILVDAPHSALNNAGTDMGERTENIVRVKVIKKGREIYPYVSAQAWRYWWRNTLQEKFGWELSPVERTEKVAFTKANPFKYPDDDVFGYMRAEKKTLTRVSPLKCSPLVSVLNATPVSDYGTMARHEGDPVPYEHEFYSTILQGIFSLDLSRIGVFYTKSQAGFKNIAETSLKEDAELSESFKNSKAIFSNGTFILPKNERVKRAKETILALNYIFGGAKQTTHLTDVTPKFILLAIIEGGNHIFMNLAFEKNGDVEFNYDGLKQTLRDYADIILTDIYAGIYPNFLNGFDERFSKEFANFTFGDDKKVLISSPVEAISKFANLLGKIDF